ncbi:MAG: hypothetical protein HUJ98_11955, partial [Bacteroidaceae bacterium]|nr:hypothetical protein [Bacteroidaceae bacterium]
WLLNSGEYVYDAKHAYFVPNEGQLSVEEIREQNKSIDLPEEELDLKRTCSSWGKSMESLSSIFSTVDAKTELANEEQSCRLEFDREIQGSDADFLYLEFADMDEDFDYIMYDLKNYSKVDAENYGIFKSLLKKEFNPGMTVVLSWKDEEGQTHSMSCNMDQGKLLIPLGGGRGWLCNGHSEVTVQVFKDEELIDTPAISDFRMLKLREIQ